MHAGDSLLWAIVLAGGNGRRLEQFTLRLFGQARPKQFCAFTGTRSMLAHTLDRVRNIISQKRILTIVNREHERYFDGHLRALRPGTLVIQPSNRDTAPGILLPLLRIARRDPRAIVAIFPSDHFILGERRFASHVRSAVSFVRRSPEVLVVLASEADSPEPSYGWIRKGAQLRGSQDAPLYRVHAFYEKPARDHAAALHEAGCLWNTMIMIGTAETLLYKFRELTPDLHARFDRIRLLLDSPEEGRAVDEIFAGLPSVNFSGAILGRTAGSLAVLPMQGVYWSDWGDERRIAADCRRFGLIARRPPGPLAVTHNKENDHESARLSRAPQTGLGREKEPYPAGEHRRHRQDLGDHYLRDRPAHP